MAAQLSGGIAGAQHSIWLLVAFDTFLPDVTRSELALETPQIPRRVYLEYCSKSQYCKITRKSAVCSLGSDLVYLLRETTRPLRLRPDHSSGRKVIRH